MECLKLYHDLSILSTRIPVPFLTHFFARFDPAKSKALASSIAHFHLRDLESADYRSAYHMLCDWFYGWNVTDASDAISGTTEHFKMRRVPREIDVREEGERVECDRICKTYETLFALSRRVLKRYYMDIEEMVPQIGQITSESSGRDEKNVSDEGEGIDDVERVWAKTTKKDKDGNARDSITTDGDRESVTGSTESLDKEMDELLRMSRPVGMTVRRKTIARSVAEPSQLEQERSVVKREESSKVKPEDVQVPAREPEESKQNVADSRGSSAGSSRATEGLNRDEAENQNADGNNQQVPANTGGFNMPAGSVRKGVLYEAPGAEDVRRALQRDINQMYVQVDRSTDYTLVCLSTAFCVLTFSQILGQQETFLKFSTQAQELSMDFVSNTLKTVWDLLNRELPGELTLQDLRHPELLRLQIERVVELRKTASGRIPKYRWRKLARKFALLHELFTSVDVHLFPNFCKAHRDGVKAAKYSTFDSSLWLTGGYDCVIRIHDIRKPHSIFRPLSPKPNGAGGLVGNPSTAGQSQAANPNSSTNPAGGNTGHICLAQYVGHKSIVTDVHFTRDDTHIVSSSFDRTIKIWNAQSASCERTLSGHVDSVTTCDVSADGRHIASGSTDCTIRLWEFNSGECIAVIKKHTRWVKVVRFSHDGRYLMTAGLDKRIYVWDLKILINSRAISHTRCIEAHSDYVLDMATARPSLLASTSRDSTVRLFDYLSGQELAVFDLQPSWGCTLCFSDDGQFLATGSFDNNVVIFRVKDATKVRQIRVLNLGILCVRFPKDLSYMVVGSSEGFLQQIPL